MLELTATLQEEEGSSVVEWRGYRADWTGMEP